jgi:dethiobiotin synthetase
MVNPPLHQVLHQSLFVTGTDTGVGKTWFCTQLLRSMVAADFRAAGMKPVAAGVEATPHGLRNADAVELMAASNVDLPYQLVNPVCLRAPTSPHLAAKDAGIAVDVNAIMEAYGQIMAKSDLIVVEGAGGWLAPIADPATPGMAGPTMQEVAVAIGLPVVLVVGIRLGALNHALLSAEAIRRSGLVLAGWAANCIEPEFADTQRYVESLALRLPEPLIWRG